MGMQGFKLSETPEELKAIDDEFVQQTKGVRDRIALVLFAEGDDDRFDPFFYGGKVLWIDGLGNVWSTPEIEKVVGERGKPKIATVVAQYNTNKKGEPVEPMEIEVKPWFLNQSKLDSLMEHHTKSSPLGMRDIVVKCKDVKYRDMDFYPKDEALWRLKESVMKEVLYKARIVASKIDIAKSKSVDEVKEALGLGDDDGPADTEDGEFDELLDDI